MLTLSPVVLDSTPYNGEINVSIYTSIRILFHVNIFTGATYNDICLRDDKGNKIDICKYICDNKLFIDPDNPLEKATLYHVDIPNGAVVDCNQYKLQSCYKFYFITCKDMELLKITSTNPVNNAIDVPIDDFITINFNEKIKEGENFNSIFLKDCKGNLRAEVSGINGCVLTARPLELLNYYMSYTLSIPAKAVCDLTNNPLKTPFILTFTTNKDKKSLIVEKTVPQEDETCVALYPTIKIVFNKKIKISNKFYYITLTDDCGNEYFITKNINGHGLYINPQKLPPCEKFTLKIPAEAVKDYSRNHLESDLELNFTTKCFKENK